MDNCETWEIVNKTILCQFGNKMLWSFTVGIKIIYFLSRRLCAICYHPSTKLQEGYVFSCVCQSVCLSVHGGGPCTGTSPTPPLSKGPRPTSLQTRSHLFNLDLTVQAAPSPHCSDFLTMECGLSTSEMIDILLKSFLVTYAFEPYLFLLNGVFTICNSDLWVLFPNQYKMFIIWKHQRINYNKKVQMIKDF